MTSSADRYAGVLFEVARDREMMDAVSDGLDYLVSLLREVEEFRSIWLHPVLGAQLKMEILDPVLEVDPLVRDFAALLADRGREKHLEDIRDAYSDLRLQGRGIKRVEVHSAAELDAEDREDIERALAGLGYDEVVVDEHRDPSLLGGVMVRIGDMKIDGSLRRRLQHVEETLSREV